MSGKVYVAIDLKSFYASVECVDRGIDPLSSYLVVADESRTDKTICLAVSPALKSFGINDTVEHHVFGKGKIIQKDYKRRSLLVLFDGMVHHEKPQHFFW